MTDTPEQIAEWKRLAETAMQATPTRYEFGEAVEAANALRAAVFAAVPALIAEVERLTAEVHQWKALDDMHQSRAIAAEAENVRLTAERDALKEAGSGLDALLEEIETVIKTVSSRHAAYQAIIDGRAVWKSTLEASK